MEIQSQVARSPLSEQIENYLGHLMTSPRTQHTYESGLHVFQAYLSEQAGTQHAPGVTTPGGPFDLTLIDSNVLQDFQSWLADEEYSRFSRKT